MEGWMAEDMESKEAALARALRQCATRPEKCSEKNCIFCGQTGCVRILKTCAAETLEQADRSKPVATGKAVLLTAEQVQNGKGVGWQEIWYEADPEEGEEEKEEEEKEQGEERGEDGEEQNGEPEGEEAVPE